MKKELCGCCEGLAKLTPMPTANRPGLNTLTYRVGTHATFLQTMKACLTGIYLELPVEDGSDQKQKIYPLQGLSIREASDPSIALLDAWATVADVLAFYQERIANEGFLRTATERLSILELARLVGYELRPGVAASVYLAFTLEEGYQVEIPAGTRAQSLPAPGELPQPFETAERLTARTPWNQLQSRMNRPQRFTLNRDNPDPETDATMIKTVYFEGTETNLNSNDLLLFVFGDEQGQQVLRRVESVELKPNEDRTKVTLQKQTSLPNTSQGFAAQPKKQAGSALAELADLLGPLKQPPSLQPSNALRLDRNVAQIFSAEADIAPKLLTTLQPALSSVLYQAWANIATPPGMVEVYALRETAALFGHNAPRKPLMFNTETGEITQTGEWPIIEEIDVVNGNGDRIIHEEANVVNLDNSYEDILSDSWLVVETGDTNLTDEGILFAKARNPNAGISRAKYGITGKTTRIGLGNPADPSQGINWITVDLNTVDPQDDDFEAVRRTVVYGQSELLTLAEAPIDPIAEPVADKEIELEALYDGLESGRWLVVSGERVDVPGVTASELVMLANVEQRLNIDFPGERPHTTLILANDLAYSYKRDTATIYGNVVKATHGETRTEVLGSGDGSKSMQQFTLKQSPLTFLSAPNPDGIESTLKVRINDIRWHEADSLAGLGPTDRRFITPTDDEDKTTIVFGNGQYGARLSTGIENVTAVYRTGIGKPGNVAAEQISLLATRPLGVKGVINPLRASGGADREGRDQARRNVPLPLMALDRLVSVQDYEDFTRSFAGIGKASATRLSDGRRQLVHVTIAGAEDIPIDKNSDLYRNLRQALHQFGDPHLPIQVAVRELMLLVITAKVRLLPDYQWESVEPKIRATMVDAFSFERCELGQDVLLSEVISKIQAVEGVAYVDVDVFDRVHQDITTGELESLADHLRLHDRISTNLARVVVEDTTSGMVVRQLMRLDEAESLLKFGDVAAWLTALNALRTETGKPPLVDPGTDSQRLELHSQERAFWLGQRTRQRVIRPAQLAYLTPDVADTLILTELTS